MNIQDKEQGELGSDPNFPGYCGRCYKHPCKCETAKEPTKPEGDLHILFEAVPIDKESPIARKWYDCLPLDSNGQFSSAFWEPNVGWRITNPTHWLRPFKQPSTL